MDTGNSIFSGNTYGKASDEIAVLDMEARKIVELQKMGFNACNGINIHARLTELEKRIKFLESKRSENYRGR